MINVNDAKRLRNAMSEINKVLAKHGLMGSIGTIRYNATEMRTKLTVVQANTNGVAGGDPNALQAQIERDQFQQLARLYGLTPADYMRKVNVVGIKKPVTLVAIKPNNRKFPIIVQTVRGKRYKVSEKGIVR